MDPLLAVKNTVLRFVAEFFVEMTEVETLRWGRSPVRDSPAANLREKAELLRIKIGDASTEQELQELHNEFDRLMSQGMALRLAARLHQKQSL